MGMIDFKEIFCRLTPWSFSSRWIDYTRFHTDCDHIMPKQKVGHYFMSGRRQLSCLSRRQLSLPCDCVALLAGKINPQFFLGIGKEKNFCFAGALHHFCDSAPRWSGDWDSFQETWCALKLLLPNQRTASIVPIAFLICIARVDSWTLDYLCFDTAKPDIWQLNILRSGILLNLIVLCPYAVP